MLRMGQNRPSNSEGGQHLIKLDKHDLFGKNSARVDTPAACAFYEDGECIEPVKTFLLPGKWVSNASI